MTGRALARRAAAGAAGLGLAGVAAVLGATGVAAAPAAGATGTFSCPSAGTSAGGASQQGSCPDVTATRADGTLIAAASISYGTCGLGSCSSATITLTPPSKSSPISKELDESDNLGGSSTSVSIPIPADVENGTWSATFTGDASGTSTFRLTVPPTVPQHVAVDTSTAGQATVTWAPSTPTTATAYALQVDGAATSLTPDCSASSCRGTVVGLASGKHTFAVVASRPDGSGGAVRSTATATGTVTAVPPANSASTGPGAGASSSAPAASGSGSTAGGSTGSVSAGGAAAAGGAGSSTGTSTATSTSAADAQAAAVAAAAAAQHRAQTFQSFAPAAGIAQLPPLPQFPTATTGGGEPTDPGTYVPTLPYDGQQTITERVSRPTLLGHVTDAASDRQVLESVAAAALVLLVAAHLRLFVRRDPAYDL